MLKDPRPASPTQLQFLLIPFLCSTEISIAHRFDSWSPLSVRSLLSRLETDYQISIAEYGSCFDLNGKQSCWWSEMNCRWRNCHIHDSALVTQNIGSAWSCLYFPSFEVDAFLFVPRLTVLGLGWVGSFWGVCACCGEGGSGGGNIAWPVRVHIDHMSSAPKTASLGINAGRLR